MKTWHLTGPEKYLAAAVLFGIVGVIFFVPLVLSGSLLAVFAFAFLPVSGFMFYFWSLSKKGYVLPEKNNKLYASFLLSWVGLSFLVVGIKITDFKAILLGGLLFVLLAPVFVMELIRIIKTAKGKPAGKLETAMKRYINIIVAIFVITALSPVLVIAIYSFIEGQIIIGSVIILVLAGGIWLFLKLRHKNE